MPESSESKPFRTVGVRLPDDLVQLITDDCERLGLTQADWMRAAVHRQLTATKMTKRQAEQYRRPTSKQGQRDYAQRWAKGQPKGAQD
jgi:hypothetical protein